MANLAVPCIFMRSNGLYLLASRLRSIQAVTSIIAGPVRDGLVPTRFLSVGTCVSLPAGDNDEVTSNANYIRQLQEEVRVARAQKAAADYRRHRASQPTSSPDPHRQEAPASNSSKARPSFCAAPDRAESTSLQEGAELTPPRGELHPSRDRRDLNAYARSAAGTVAYGATASRAIGPGGAGGIPARLGEEDGDELGSADGQAWQPVTLGESGLEAIVERRIRDSVARGELDNLKGRGQPLDSLQRHDAQFFRVDPLMAALCRSMGAQALRPRSLELRDELAAAQRDFEEAVAQEVQRRRSRNQGWVWGGVPPAGAAAPRAAASWTQWLGRGRGVSEARRDGSAEATEEGMEGDETPPPAGRSRELAERLAAEIASAETPRLSHAFEEVQRLRLLFNGAVLADKETFGSGWPLEQVRRTEYDKEVARIVVGQVLEERERGDGAGAAG